MQVKCTFVEILTKNDTLIDAKVESRKCSFFVLLDISFQKYTRLSKINVRGEKIKSRKYCEQRWSIPELQIHLPFLIVLSVENISPLCFLLVWLYVSLIKSKRWQLPKKKALPCFIHMVDMCGQIQQEERI